MIQNNQKPNEHRYGNILVSIEQGNLVTLKNVDAIVNAANVYLQAGAGVCGAVFDACGESELMKECKQYLKNLSETKKTKIRKIETGDCAVTSSCRLKANNIQFIFHSPGPVFDTYDEKKSRQELRTTIENILERAKELQIKSVAIPAISSGIYGFPKDLCAKIFKEVLWQNNFESELHVRLVNRDTETFEIFRKVFNIQKPIVFSQDYKIKQQDSILVVPVLWEKNDDKEGKLTVTSDVLDSILNKEDMEKYSLIEQKLEQAIQKQQNFHIFTLETDKLKQIYDYRAFIVVGFQKPPNQIEHNHNQDKDQLFELYSSVFESIKPLKQIHKYLISIPLIDLVLHIFQKEKLSDEDKKVAFKQLLNAQQKSEIELNINIITDKETQNYLEDYLNKQNENPNL